MVQKTKQKPKKPKQKPKPVHKFKSVKIYGETWCPYCTNSKLIATKHSKKVEFLHGKSPEQLRRILKLPNAPRTIPQIVVNGKYIGGFSNLQKLV